MQKKSTKVKLVPAKVKLITIKVTETAWKNFNMASAMSGLSQYQMSEQASYYILGYFESKQKTK